MHGRRYSMVLQSNRPGRVLSLYRLSVEVASLVCYNLIVGTQSGTRPMS